MRKLEEIDKNFKVETNLKKNDICFYSPQEKPFEIYGLIYENGKYRRMPENVANSVSEWVGYLHSNTAGGRVRFKTDSKYVAISAKMCNIGKMDHFAITGSAGFDMYVREKGNDKFNGTFRPSFDIQNGYESVLDFETKKMREITINFPLYSDVCELYIGLEETAKVQAPTPYSYSKPIVYYGSSITQGGCATRPGNAYPSILSRKLDIDHINLGFSGSAKGEEQITKYIASLDMQIFVYDYDHNAPNTEHLMATHEKMYKAIRKENPSLPIIMMSAVSGPRIAFDMKGRRDVVYQTYKNAKENGDENVYFWDGSKKFAKYREYGTVEGCHPNDYGFVGMANALQGMIKQILQKEKNNGK